MLPSVCAPKCRGAGLQIGLRCMTLRCALYFVPNGKIMLHKCDAVLIFLVKNGGTKSGSKGSCLKNKRLEDKGRKWIAGESPKETKNLKLMLNVAFIDEKLFILIARKVIAELWFFVVYCFDFGVFLSHRLHLVLVNVSS